jgi:hypothetical protein
VYYNKGEANRTPTYDVEDQYTTFILRPYCFIIIIHHLFKFTILTLQYFDTLDNNKLYTILPILKNGIGENKTMSSSIKISKGTDPVLLAERLL